MSPPATSPATPSREPGLRWRALWCLALAGAVFVFVYGFCNHFTATRGDVRVAFFAWERHIPFIPAMVVPYWTLDFFFCGSFFLCATRRELHRHTLRMIVVTVLSGICFLLVPLRFGWDRPGPSGWTAPFFQLLYAQDLPYNLAPSLHISLRSLVWIIYGAHLRGRFRSVVKTWFILIGFSTLFVWQHHLLDVAGGFLMGWLVQALIPDRTAPRVSLTPAHHRLARRYAAGALACALLALPGGGWWWFAWPAVAFTIPAIAYWRGDAALMGKENGTLSPSAEWCLLPAMLGARWIVRKHLRREPSWYEPAPGLRIGRRLSDKQARAMLDEGEWAILDLTCEGNATPAFRESPHYLNIPVLDLTSPGPDAQRQALDFIRAHHGTRRVYVHCQLGLMRSAAIGAAWLVESGHAQDADEAFRRIVALQPAAIVPGGAK